MGRVFLAQRTDLGQVAIKVLRENGPLPHALIERFRREAQSASRLRSESVVRVLDMGKTADGAPFIVMEHVVGKTLAQHLSDDGPFEVSRAVDIVIEVCGVLAEAHAHGIVHRDIKSANVALTRRPDGTELVKVLDFGIAKQTASSVSSLTETAAVLGSPKYMSPEQIRDARAVKPLDDLWSLSVLLQELTTGGLPFEAFTVPGLFAKIVADPPTPARTRRPELPLELEALLLKALAKDPADRFQDAAELAEALLTFASPDGARRALRVRSIFEHAKDVARSEPPPASDAPLTAIDLDATEAPTARENPAAHRAPSPAAGRRRPVVLVAAVALAALVIGAGAWRVRPSTGASTQPTPPAADAAIAATRDPAPPSSGSASRDLQASTPASPASPPPTPLAASPTAPPLRSTPPSSSGPPKPSSTARRSAVAGAGPSARVAPPGDDEFGPRQ